MSKREQLQEAVNKIDSFISTSEEELKDLEKEEKGTDEIEGMHQFLKNIYLMQIKNLKSYHHSILKDLEEEKKNYIELLDIELLKDSEKGN